MSDACQVFISPSLFICLRCVISVSVRIHCTTCGHHNSFGVGLTEHEEKDNISREENTSETRKEERAAQDTTKKDFNLGPEIGIGINVTFDVACTKCGTKLPVVTSTVEHYFGDDSVINGKKSSTNNGGVTGELTHSILVNSESHH